jgi:CARDB
MIRTAALLSIALTLMPMPAYAAGCTGASPVVTSVSVVGVTRTRYLNYYRVSATVTNRGSDAQAGNVLQFVDVMQYGDRLDDRGVPPLAPGQSYTISYVWKRAVDAGKGTTPLDFGVRPVSPTTGNPPECAVANGGSSSIMF